MSRVASTHYHFETMKTARLLIGCAVFFVLLAVALVPPLLHFGSAAGVLGAVGLGILAVGWLAVALSHGEKAGIGFEWKIRQTFRRVCAERHLVGSDRKTPAFARYGYLVGTPDAFRLHIRPLVGQSLTDWEKATAAFSMAFGSRSVRFDDRGDGTIAMKVGTQMIDAAPLDRITDKVMLDPSPMTWREYLSTVIVGKTEQGEPYGLPLIDSHVLIAGMTGAGKGSWIWEPILRLTPAAKAGAVRFWGFDPKRMELGLGRQLFGDRYASTPEAMVELLERAHDEMQQRADSLSGKARKFNPSPETPLNVLVIDELGYLVALISDRKITARVEKALSGILVLGRAVGFAVIGAVQDPRKSTVDFRDLFPVRVALRLPKGMVELVLGSGMYEAGAQCDLIPAGVLGAGRAYVLAENSTTPIAVRAAWCSDELIMETAASYTEPEPPTAIAS